MSSDHTLIWLQGVAAGATIVVLLGVVVAVAIMWHGETRRFELDRDRARDDTDPR